MHSKMLAVAVAAGLGLSALSGNAAAQNKTAVSPSDLAQIKAQIAALQAQNEALKAQLAELEQRTDAQSDINVSQAQKVETIEKSQKKIDALDKLVNNTKIGGTMFFDMTNLEHHERVGNGRDMQVDGHGSINGTGYDVKRFYLAVDHKFDDMWSANLTTDFNYVSAVGQTSLFVKKAFVQAKFDDLFALRFGAADMPWIPFVEKWYGYRFLENTLTDRNFEGGRSNATANGGGVGAFANSSDWGLHALGASSGDNAINYQLSVVNGRGFRNPSRSGHVDVEGRFAYSPIENMVMAVGGYEGKRGNQVENGQDTRSASRGDLMVAYRDKTFGIGGEYMIANNWDDILKYAGNGAAPLSVKDRGTGYSLWADWSFAPQWAVFARYDSLDYKYWTVARQERRLTDRFYDLGVSYDVLKNLRLALAWKHNTLDGPDATPYHYKTHEIGFWGMLTF